MKYILEHQPKITAKYVIVCEGMGDVELVNTLLNEAQVTHCQVGCPSVQSTGGSGKSKISEYLSVIKAEIDLNDVQLDGIIVIGDADASRESTFKELQITFTEAGFIAPKQPFVVDPPLDGQQTLKTGIFIIPGLNRDGCLEHLLLDAVSFVNPGLFDCARTFLTCVEEAAKTRALTENQPSPTPSLEREAERNATENQKAKMMMSAIVAATCKKNPWASAAMLWHDKGNPVSISLSVFDELRAFIKDFTK